MLPSDLRKRLYGVTVISTTPFKEDRSFDPDGYEKYLQFIIDGGLDASNATIVVGGSTGECGSMLSSERKELVEWTVKSLGDRLPVIAGCNSTNIYESIELAKHAESVGAAGVMALAPYYYPPRDQNCIYEFYKMLSDSIGIGILLYNNFEVMNVDTSVETLKRVKNLPNVVGLKECTPAFYKMTRVADEISDEVAVVNGHGEFLEPFAALAGTAGFISSMSTFAPERAVAIWNARSTGDYATAKKVRDTLVPYMDLAVKFSGMGGESKVIALLKYAADLVGSCGGYGRVPTLPLSSEEKQEVEQVLGAVGVL